MRLRHFLLVKFTPNIYKKSRNRLKEVWSAWDYRQISNQKLQQHFWFFILSLLLKSSPLTHRSEEEYLVWNFFFLFFLDVLMKKKIWNKNHHTPTILFFVLCNQKKKKNQKKKPITNKTKNKKPITKNTKKNSIIIYRKFYCSNFFIASCGRVVAGMVLLMAWNMIMLDPRRVVATFSLSFHWFHWVYALDRCTLL